MEKTPVIVKNIVHGTLTNTDALPLQLAMHKLIADGKSMILSFDGVNVISSSFLNSSLGEIISKHGFDILKGKLSITDYTPEIAATIKKYISDYKNLYIN